MIDKEIIYDSKIYEDGKFIRINEGKEEYFNNFKLNTERTKNENGFYKEKIINTIYNKNSNLEKIVKNYINNKDKIYDKNNYLSINKNIAYSDRGNFNVINEKIKKNYQNGNEKKINLVINTFNNNNIGKQSKFDIIPSNNSGEMCKIKKINLINLNGNATNNNSFYEIKSLSPSQKMTKTKHNNNQIINIVYKNNNNELIVDKVKNSNTKLIEYNNMKDIINLNQKKNKFTKLNTSIGKNKKPIFPKKKIYRKIFELANSSQRNINNAYGKSKENINIMNVNSNSNNYIKNKNSKIDNIINDKMKKINNKIIKIEKKNIKSTNDNKNKSSKSKILVKKNVIINEKNKNSNGYAIKLKNKKPNYKRPLNSIIYLDTRKPMELKKINSSNFTYFPISKKSNLSSKKYKKIKRLSGDKNIVQLSNINVKTYEEDFPLNAKKNIIDEKNLKPQISFRIALFGKKEQEYEKYFLVNVFHSENIKERLVETESEF